MYLLRLVNLLLTVGYYIAECICDNSIHCDGASLDTRNSRRCTAVHKQGSRTPTKVSKIAQNISAARFT